MKQAPIHSGVALQQFIPQRPPFVMVDALYEKGESHVLSGFTVLEENLLVKEQKLQEGGLVENIAQTAALLAGLRYADLGLPAPVGFIASIKDLEIKQLPVVGSRLLTKTILTHDLGNIQVVEGEVKDEQDQLLARCELRIFIKEEAKANRNAEKY